MSQYKILGDKQERRSRTKIERPDNLSSRPAYADRLRQISWTALRQAAGDPEIAAEAVESRTRIAKSRVVERCLAALPEMDSADVAWFDRCLKIAKREIRRIRAWIRSTSVDESDLESHCNELIVLHYRTERDPKRMRVWLRSRISDYMRHEERQLAVGLGRGETREADFDALAQDDGAEFDLASDILRFLPELPQTQQEVANLVFVEGHTVAEAARLLGRSYSSVEERLKRALESLRKKYGVTP